MKKVLGDKRTIFLFCLPGMVLFLAFVIYPLINVVVMSFQQYNGVTPGTFNGLENYWKIFQEEDFWAANWRSLYLCLLPMFVDTFLVLVFTLIIVVLNRTMQKLCKIAFLLPFVLSISVISQLWLAIYHPDWGILNAFLDAIGLHSLTHGWLLDPNTAMVCIGFVGMWWIFGMQLLLIYTGYRSIPETYFEAAEIDGANYLQKVRAITIPLLRNILQLSLIMTSVGGLYTFPQVYIMTKGGPGNSTETIMMYMYKQVFSNQRFGLGSSIAVVAILETCIVLVIIMMLTKQKKIEF